MLHWANASGLPLVSDLLQRLREIGNQVLRMLQPDGDPEEVFRRLRQHAFDRGAMLDERLGAAQARGARDQLQARRQCEGLRAAARTPIDSIPPASRI